MFKDLFMSEFSGESDLIDMDTGIGEQKRLFLFLGQLVDEERVKSLDAIP